jgi:hypothetical protein
VVPSFCLGALLRETKDCCDYIGALNQEVGDRCTKGHGWPDCIGLPYRPCEAKDGVKAIWFFFSTSDLLAVEGRCASNSRHKRHRDVVLEAFPLGLLSSCVAGKFETPHVLCFPFK